ncbi:MAG: barstar family protein [Micromonosporaceae bacterium]
MSTARARLNALLRGTPPPGIYRWTSRAHPAAMRRELAAVDWGCHLLDGRTVRDRARFFDACAETLRLPAWFGGNFDALADCLADLSWLSGQGQVLLWQQYGVFADHDPEGWDTAREVFADAAAARVRTGLTPLYVLLRGNGPTDGLAAI